jgi:small conductance mechanosensitive channel
MVLVYTVGVLWVLQWLNLIPGSLLALGTVIALVISFAAQNLVKDLVNGFMILLEDQFRIGDFIRIGANAGLQEVSGLVENLNLRITQIRSTEGNLIIFANSSIVQVENMSRTWARADFYIEVAYETDVNRALAIIRDTADKLAQDPQWHDVILDSHELLGVEQLSHSGIMIRLWIKTAPLQQWNVARELRRRLKLAFDQSDIRIGIPQQIWLKDGSGAIKL